MAESIQKLVKTASFKSLVVRMNLVFLAFFLVIYAALVLRQWSSVYFDNAASLVRCSMHECHHKMENINGVQRKLVLAETRSNALKPRGNLTKIEVPSFVNKMGKKMKIGMVNMEDNDTSDWQIHGETIQVDFERVSNYFKWEDLFPEWIDEEEEVEGTSCPEIPMPEFERYGDVDIVVTKLPCKFPHKMWNRDVFRLQVHLIAANLAVKRGNTKVLFWSKCRPMMELFRCDDLVKQEGDWWLYKPQISWLQQKLSLPVGSCMLSLPLWAPGTNKIFDLSKIESTTVTSSKREAYATVLHSSESYVCGAVALAQSLRQTGTKRDLILLLDKSISEPKREVLARAGWQIRIIKRIRNPRARKNTYNEYNYSKFRLWQLTDYDKIVFIDSDIIVLRNLDVLFYFPQMSATGNDNWIFNSGIMVIEPSKCTFKMLMEQRQQIVSYNGGDQGFLNEVFTWWHRLPRRVNFLKNFWSNTTLEASVKNELLGADPPKVYSIHYLGLKPWNCYRDYDCNWNVGDQRVYASDVAHKTWWKFHDGMHQDLQKFCGLTKQRKINLDWERRVARLAGFVDAHWKINITDPRRQHLI